MGQGPEDSCWGKIPHRTKAAAMAHRFSLMTNRGAFGRRVKVYRCNFCDFFHVGNSRPPRRR